MTVTWSESDDLNSAIVDAILNRLSSDISDADIFLTAGTSTDNKTNVGATPSIVSEGVETGEIAWRFDVTLSNDNESLSEIKLHDAGGTEYIDYSLSSAVALGNSANDDIYFEIDVDITNIVWAN